MREIIYFLAGFIVAPIAIFAQGSISYSYISAQQAANQLCGGGVHPFNATFTGASYQLASFYNSGSTMPISSGIALTTGDASFIATQQTGNEGDQATTPGNTPDDPDLAALQPGDQIGTCYLEFDAHIETWPLTIPFSFASEEYNFYTFSNYSDVMGIFMSGPGITGTLNLGTANGSHVSVPTVNACTNNGYFINNCSVSSNCVGTRPQDPCPFPSVGDHNFPYNGCTKSTVGNHFQTDCNNTYVYHFKIAIANITDSNMDSGIFLQQNGLYCQPGGGQLVAQPSPVCDGTQLVLSYTYDPNAQAVTNINWSTGQTGTSTTANAIADINNPLYTATVTAGLCTEVYTLNVNVSTTQNVPPYVNGVNNSGDYVIYEVQGQPSCVNIPSFDTPNEQVLISSPNYPAGFNFSPVNSYQQSGNLCYTGNGAIGLTTFNVNTQDKNACGSLTGTSTFTVKTLCGYCDIDLYYQNRQPGNNPLPPFTKAGRSITAGENVDPSQPTGIVDTGTDPVEFKAASVITVIPGFVAGPNFHAWIDPNSCVNDCNDCCDHFNGITVDPIANVFTPNGDGVNDVWQVTDRQHPHCAYSANSFELNIYNQYGTEVVYTESGSSSECCGFRSPDIYNNGGYATISWDGAGMDDDVYYYVLSISGCGTTANYTGNIQIFGSGVHRDATPTDTTKKVNSSTGIAASNMIDGANFRPQKSSSIEDKNALEIFPNPAHSTASIILNTQMSSGPEQNASVEIYDVLGNKVGNLNIPINRAVSLPLDNLKSGSYIVKISYNFTNFIRTLVVVP